MIDPAPALVTEARGTQAWPGDISSSRDVARLENSHKMRVLHILSSANQLYSGIGRALFELTLRMKDRATFEFAIDDYYQRNVDHLLNFCEKHGFRVHVGTGRLVEESLDTSNEELPGLLGQGRWDLIECLSWANSSTNATVLEGLGDAVLSYTPHYQPIWTVPMSAQQAANTEAVHLRVLQNADVVFCDSPWERRVLQGHAPHRGNCVFLPLGCHFEDFRPGPPTRKPQLLFVGDLAEPRKRTDRLLAVFARLRRYRPELRLVVIGSRSEDFHHQIPAELQSSCDLRGYVSEQELRQAYAECLGLILLSDYEAFGIPIMEALACGTPVFLSRLAATRSLFGSYRGAHFCPADDLEGTLRVVEDVLSAGSGAILEVMKDRESLRATFDWDVLAVQKWNDLAAAWYRKNLTGYRK